MTTAVHFGLEGRVVVITGASQGIGEACARRLVKDGAAVALWDVADGPGLALAAELTASGAATQRIERRLRARRDPRELRMPNANRIRRAHRPSIATV